VDSGKSSTNRPERDERMKDGEEKGTCPDQENQKITIKQE
jgi:hypothetical protein